MKIPAFIIAAALALGLTLATSPAQAYDDTRIWVSIGDVTFSAGRPYHRYHDYPLHVWHGPHGPRYYYHHHYVVSEPVYYHRPHGHAPYHRGPGSYYHYGHRPYTHPAYTNRRHAPPPRHHYRHGHGYYRGY